MLRHRTTATFKRLFKTALGFTSFAMLAAGCNDVPTPVGSDFVQDTSIITKVASSATLPLIEKSSVERISLVRMNDLIKNIGFGNTNVLVGATTLEQRAYTFANPASFADSLKNITEANLISTSLLLTPTAYAVGDTSATEFAFKVYSLKKLWSYQDTLETIFPSGNQSEYFDANASIAEFKGTVDRANGTGIEVSLPKNMIAQWFASGDSASGLALAPDVSSKYIQQFKALNSDLSAAINIRVVYTTAANTQDTLLLPLPYYGSFVQAPGAVAASDVIIQSGTSYRTVFDIDLTSIEAFASVHSAKLILHLDTEQKSAQQRRYILVERLPNTAGNFNDFLASYGSLSDAATKRYEFTGLGARIERWMRTTRKGRLYLLMEGESETADRASFFGLNAADSTLRPRLEILYSTRPK